MNPSTEPNYIPFKKVCHVNTLLFQIFRAAYEDAAPGDYKFYLQLYDLHPSFSNLFALEQSYKLRSQAGEPETTTRALRKLIETSQAICNALKIHCIEQHLGDLQSIELKLIIILRDMHRDTNADRILSREVDNIKHQIQQL
jgi:hypothetical protein